MSQLHQPFATSFAHGIYADRYQHGNEGWDGTSRRVVGGVMGSLYATEGAKTGKFSVEDILAATERQYELHRDRKLILGGRYLANVGRDFKQTQNCLLMRCEDTREGWGEMAHNVEMALLTGAGIGVYWGDVRGEGSEIKRTGGIASGPIPKMISTNEQGRAAVQGGKRRCAIWGGMPWWHPDIFKLVRAKDWPKYIRDEKEAAAKEGRFDVPAPLDMTNISVCLDDDFFVAYADRSCEKLAPLREAHGMTAPDGGTWHDWAVRIYRKTVDKMVTTGEPGFSVDMGDKVNEKLRNACTEITSEDDSDVCNLGSLVMPRFDNVEEFEQAVRDAVLLLTAGTLYSDLPYSKVYDVREKNRRLGLGLIGQHEFVMRRGARYGTPEAHAILEPYMRAYARALEFAHVHQDRLRLSLSKGATAIAPNGTIGIVAESTPSDDPLFSKAEKRRIYHVTGGKHANAIEHEFVVDPVAAGMLADGVDLSVIEDAYDLSYDVERRFQQQAFTQQYVDHAVSSTVNLPYVMKNEQEQLDFGDMLMKYLPQLRGVTCYPDGARAGQPRTPVPLEYALEHQGVRFESEEEVCASGVCGV